MADFPKNRNRIGLTTGNWIVLFVITAVTGLLAFETVPSFWRPRCSLSPKSSCISNLRQIDGAKEQWALENHHYAGEPVIETEVAAYIKGGQPVCPGGGKYVFGKVEEVPRCTIRGHTIN